MKVDGNSSNAVTDIINGVAPANFAQLYRANWVQGTDACFELGGRTALVEQQFSKKHGVGVGDTYRIRDFSGGTDAAGDRHLPRSGLPGLDRLPMARLGRLPRAIPG